MMKDGASREEELSKKAVKEQLESFDMESLVRMNEADDGSRLSVKNLVNQGAMHGVSASK